MAMDAMLVLPYILLTSRSFCLPDYTQLIALLFLGVVPTALASVSWQHALAIAGRVSRIANLEFFIPALGILFAMLLLGERVSWCLVVGMIIIMGSAYGNKRINPMQE